MTEPTTADIREWIRVYGSSEKISTEVILKGIRGDRKRYKRELDKAEQTIKEMLEALEVRNIDLLLDAEGDEAIIATCESITTLSKRNVQTIREISEFKGELRLSADEITCSAVSKILLRGAANDLQAILNRSKL